MSSCSNSDSLEGVASVNKAFLPVEPFTPLCDYTINAYQSYLTSTLNDFSLSNILRNISNIKKINSQSSYTTDPAAIVLNVGDTDATIFLFDGKFHDYTKDLTILIKQVFENEHATNTYDPDQSLSNQLAVIPLTKIGSNIIYNGLLLWSGPEKFRPCPIDTIKQLKVSTLCARRAAQIQKCSFFVSFDSFISVEKLDTIKKIVLQNSLAFAVVQSLVKIISIRNDKTQHEIIFRKDKLSEKLKSFEQDKIYAEFCKVTLFEIPYKSSNNQVLTICISPFGYILPNEIAINEFFTEVIKQHNLIPGLCFSTFAETIPVHNLFDAMIDPASCCLLIIPGQDNKVIGTVYGLTIVTINRCSIVSIGSDSITILKDTISFK